MKGGYLIRRGIGIPVRPPAFWTKVTEVSVTVGCGRRSGRATAATDMLLEPSRMVVLPIWPPPSWPWPTMRPSSTSIQPWSTLANRKRSPRRSASRSSIVSGGGSS